MKIFMIVIPLFIACTGWFLFQRKKKKQYDYYVNMKLREKELDERLKTCGGYSGEKQYHSYRTDYYEYADETEKARTCQLVEKTGCMQRVFLLQEAEEAYIVRENGVLLVLKEASEAELVCKINCKQGHWCIRSLGRIPVSVTRKMAKNVINGNGIILENGDKIRILKSEFKFTN